MQEIEDFASEFFAPDFPPRDGKGRPMLIPSGVERRDENRVPYSRASSLGDKLEDHIHLWKWKMRGLAVGLAQSMDLIRLAAAENYTCGFADDVKANAASGRRVDEVIDRAMDRAGVSMKADYGTAIHARTEPENNGNDPDDKQRIEVESCWDLWADLGVVNIGTEVFTACDELRSAGTFDHLSYVPGYGIVVTDKKTSAKPKATYDVQLGSYSRSDVYDPETDERMTLEEYIASLGWDPALLNRSVGIIWWIKNGRTEARFLDLDKGFAGAKVAAWIRDERDGMGTAPNVTKTIQAAATEQRARLLEALRTAPSAEALMSIWGNPTAQALWTEDHTAAATARKGEL